MTTFRTCDNDMLGFIDYLVEKSIIQDEWSEIRYVLEKPFKYMVEYELYQDHQDIQEGDYSSLIFRCKVCEKIVPIESHSIEDYKSLRQLGMCKTCYLNGEG